MKLNRMRLRRLIESVLREEENPGSKFASAAKKGKENKSEQIKQRATEELQKTYDWFVEVVFPAIENNKWPIVTDDKYLLDFFDLTLTGIEDFDKYTEGRNLKKGTKIKSIDDKIDLPFFFGRFTTLGKAYRYLEEFVIENNLRVTMQSDQPEEFEKAVEVAKKDPKVQSEREKEIEDRGGTIPGDPEEERLNEGLSRGSLYRRRYRRY